MKLSEQLLLVSVSSCPYHIIDNMGVDCCVPEIANR
jgi:hypothetical protein